MALSSSGLRSVISSLAVFEIPKFGKHSNILSIITFITGFPFLLKPVLGFISDVLPIFRFRFKSYLIGNLVVQLGCCLVIYFVKDPSLMTLLVLNAVLNVTATFMICLLQGMITLATKIDSKIRFPEFLNKSANFESKSNRLIGIYQCFFLLSVYAYDVVIYLTVLNVDFSSKIIFAMAGSFSTLTGLIILYFFEDRKVRKKEN